MSSGFVGHESRSSDQRRRALSTWSTGGSESRSTCLVAPRRSSDQQDEDAIADANSCLNTCAVIDRVTAMVGC